MVALDPLTVGAPGLHIRESLREAVGHEEALLLLARHVSSVEGRKLIHLDIDDALHVAALECVSSDLLREGGQLHTLIEYHELLLRLQFSLAVC